MSRPEHEDYCCATQVALTRVNRGKGTGTSQAVFQEYRRPEVRGGPVSRILSTPDRDPGLDDHSSANRVTTAVKLPTRASRALASLRRYPRPCGPGPAPREAPIWHCSGWGLPCRFCYQSRGGLLPHRFTFTLANKGSLFSVALSLRLPSPGITRHPCQLESGLSSDVAARGHPALRAGSDYACGVITSTGKRRARSAASARSVASSGPVAQGRKRRRKVASSVSVGRSG